MHLYKYLPQEHVESVATKGDLLFRNLSYFKKLDEDGRGDPLEGVHHDNPHNDITISVSGTSKIWKGDASFLNKATFENIFVFCLSKSYSRDLYEEFRADCCIEICYVDEFLRKSRIAVKQKLAYRDIGLLHQTVFYYSENRPAPFDIKDPKKLVFAKKEKYSCQDEYRLCFGPKKAFKLTQEIVINSGYNPVGEAQKGTSMGKHLVIGNLSDIVKVHYK